MFWSGAFFGAFGFWLSGQWCVFIQREVEAISKRRRQEQHFRHMEAAAVIVAQRLTDAEKAEIRLELYR